MRPEPDSLRLAACFLVIVCGCGSGSPVCEGGTCRRTVQGAFQTTYWADDGTKTTLSAPPWVVEGGPATPSALLVPDSGGYAKLPLTIDSDQRFSVPDVPVGRYFLELDLDMAVEARCNRLSAFTTVVIANLFELTASTPDLTRITAERPDLAFGVVTGTTPESPVRFGLSGLDPWSSSDTLRILSSQAFDSWTPTLQPAPPVGSTSAAVSFSWGVHGMPDPRQHDVVFVQQRRTTPIGSGASAASLTRTARFARLTDLSIPFSEASAAVGLGEPPRTGALAANVAASQFAALAPDVSPDAAPSDLLVLVLGAPHSVSYPEMPLVHAGASLLLLRPSNVDADYGTLTYGQFLDPLWKEYRRVFQSFDVQSGAASAFLFSDVPMSDVDSAPIAPVLGPPSSPRIEGKDAFTAQTGVGLEPTISWSPPRLGAATSYVVDVLPTAYSCEMADQVVGVSAVVRGTSFRMPAGMLRSGVSYRVTLTARQAPWDTADAGPFRTGTPLHSAQCVTGTFVP